MQSNWARLSGPEAHENSWTDFETWATILDGFSRYVTMSLASGADRHLEKQRVVIFAAGTGNPFFTTDTAAVLRASEIGAEVVIKATKTDGVYDKDPLTNPDARRFTTLSYDEVLKRNLKVMDATAIAFCRDNQLPIIVLDIHAKNSILKAVCGESIGTLIH